MPKTFDHLILIGRPACGKSEFIDFMKKTPVAERAENFHIGNYKRLDDFVWLWQKFEEDDIWERAIGKRFFSVKSEHAYVGTTTELLEFMFHKFNYEIEKHFLKDEDFYKDSTVLIEFARGKEKDGGYTKAFSLLSKELLERAVVLYFDVSYEESRRRNISRYEEKLKHSILAHKVPEEDLIRFSATTDWPEVTGGRESGYLELKGLSVPFFAMRNEPKLPPGPEIANRYKNALDRLFELYAPSSLRP